MNKIKPSDTSSFYKPESPEVIALYVRPLQKNIKDVQAMIKSGLTDIEAYNDKFTEINKVTQALLRNPLGDLYLLMECLIALRSDFRKFVEEAIKIDNGDAAKAGTLTLNDTIENLARTVLTRLFPHHYSCVRWPEDYIPVGIKKEIEKGIIPTSLLGRDFLAVGKIPKSTLGIKSLAELDRPEIEHDSPELFLGNDFDAENLTEITLEQKSQPEARMVGDEVLSAPPPRTPSPSAFFKPQTLEEFVKEYESQNGRHPDDDWRLF